MILWGRDDIWQKKNGDLIIVDIKEHPEKSWSKTFNKYEYGYKRQ